MTSISFVLTILSILMLNTGCQTDGSEITNGTTGLQKIYVDGMSVVSHTAPLELEVTGSLPSPAYTFDRFGVETRDGVIEITPLARFDAGVEVSQVLVPFKLSCKVNDLKPGTYQLTVFGKDDSSLSMLVQVGS
jgi:hypothetical protein